MAKKKKTTKKAARGNVIPIAVLEKRLVRLSRIVKSRTGKSR
jgi:hypothetical protein